MTDEANRQAVHFEAVKESHLPMLHDWLTRPHVSRWWGNPDHELELIRTGRSSGEADGYVAIVDGEPVGYVQSWSPHLYDDEPWLREMPAEALGIDIFIGNLAMTGQGVGARILGAFVQKLMDGGAAYIVVDPDLRNEYAIKAYSRAGFVPVSQWPEEEGGTLLMKLPERQN